MAKGSFADLPIKFELDWIKIKWAIKFIFTYLSGYNNLIDKSITQHSNITLFFLSIKREEKYLCVIRQ